MSDLNITDDDGFFNHAIEAMEEENGPLLDRDTDDGFFDHAIDALEEENGPLLDRDTEEAGAQNF